MKKYKRQLYKFNLTDGTTVFGWKDEHFTGRGHDDWPTMELTDGRLVGTHVSQLTPIIEGETDAA